MYPDCFQMAADGWHIISRYPEARESARRLLLWLTEALGVSAAEIRYRDAQTSYGWQERVDRIPSNSTAAGWESTWNHPFPVGSSYWLFEDFRGNRNEIGNLLNLLAEQWLLVHEVDSPELSGQGPRSKPVGKVSVNPAWVAVSRSSRIILSCLFNLSHSRRPLLLIGENGCGKAYLASLIHINGPNPSAPFSGIDRSGNTGTLFVPDWQVLHEEKQTDIISDKRRIISAAIPGSEIDVLREAWNLKTGGRGSVLTVPALRNRVEDIPYLAGRFLEQLTAGTGFPLPEISPAAVEALVAYPWPGNVRELKETMAWALERIEGSQIGIGDLPPAVRGAVGTSPEPSFTQRLAALEYEALKEELSRRRGNMTQTAMALGLTPRQVSSRVRKYGINPRDFKPGNLSAVR